VNKKRSSYQELRFAVPDLFDPEYESNLFELNRSSPAQVVELYGGFANDTVLGGIRPAASIPEVSLAYFRKHVTTLHRHKMQFNYTANTTVLDGAEHSVAERQRLLRFIGSLADAGVDHITLSIPYLIDQVKRFYPTVGVVASICCDIKSIGLVRRYAEMGVDRIVLPREINRSFPTLLEILGALKRLRVKCELLCNSPCLLFCPDSGFHAVTSSLLSGGRQFARLDRQNQLCVSVYRCWDKRCSSIDEYIKSPWIRPEDCNTYSSIGVDIFKLDGRDKAPAYVQEVVTAYLRQRFLGNLLYLTAPYYAKNRRQFNEYRKKGWPPGRAPLYLDNVRLNGFLRPFACQQLDCLHRDCQECGYCTVVCARTLMSHGEEWRRYASANRQEYAKFFGGPNDPSRKELDHR
jgi:collagenase-like PrtC family protease